MRANGTMQRDVECKENPLGGFRPDANRNRRHPGQKAQRRPRMRRTLDHPSSPPSTDTRNIGSCAGRRGDGKGRRGYNKQIRLTKRGQGQLYDRNCSRLGHEDPGVFQKAGKGFQLPGESNREGLPSDNEQKTAQSCEDPPGANGGHKNSLNRRYKLITGLHGQLSKVQYSLRSWRHFEVGMVKNDLKDRLKTCKISMSSLKRHFSTMTQKDKQALRIQLSTWFPKIFYRPTLKELQEALVQMKTHILTRLYGIKLMEMNNQLSESKDQRALYRREIFQGLSDQTSPVYFSSMVPECQQRLSKLSVDVGTESARRCKEKEGFSYSSALARIDKRHRSSDSKEAISIMQVQNWRHDLMTKNKGFPTSDRKISIENLAQETPTLPVPVTKKVYEVPQWFQALLDDELVLSLTPTAVKMSETWEHLDLPRRLVIFPLSNRIAINHIDGHMCVSVREQEYVSPCVLPRKRVLSQTSGVTRIEQNSYGQLSLSNDVEKHDNHDNNSLRSAAFHSNLELQNSPCWLPLFPTQRTLSFTYNWHPAVVRSSSPTKDRKPSSLRYIVDKVCQIKGLGRGKVDSELVREVPDNARLKAELNTPITDKRNQYQFWRDIESDKKQISQRITSIPKAKFAQNLEDQNRCRILVSSIRQSDSGVDEDSYNKTHRNRVMKFNVSNTVSFDLSTKSGPCESPTLMKEDRNMSAIRSPVVSKETVLNGDSLPKFIGCTVESENHQATKNKTHQKVRFVGLDKSFSRAKDELNKSNSSVHGVDGVFECHQDITVDDIAEPAGIFEMNSSISAVQARERESATTVLLNCSHDFAVKKKYSGATSRPTNPPLSARGDRGSDGEQSETRHDVLNQTASQDASFIIEQIDRQGVLNRAVQKSSVESDCSGARFPQALLRQKEQNYIKYRRNKLSAPRESLTDFVKKQWRSECDSYLFGKVGKNSEKSLRPTPRTVYSATDQYPNFRRANPRIDHSKGNRKSPKKTVSNTYMETRDTASCTRRSEHKHHPSPVVVHGDSSWETMCKERRENYHILCKRVDEYYRAMTSDQSQEIMSVSSTELKEICTNTGSGPACADESARLRHGSSGGHMRTVQQEHQIDRQHMAAELSHNAKQTQTSPLLGRSARYRGLSFTEEEMKKIIKCLPDSEWRNNLNAMLLSLDELLSCYFLERCDVQLLHWIRSLDPKKPTENICRDRSHGETPKSDSQKNTSASSEIRTEQTNVYQKASNSELSTDFAKQGREKTGERNISVNNGSEIQMTSSPRRNSQGKSSSSYRLALQQRLSSSNEPQGSHPALHNITDGRPLDGIPSSSALDIPQETGNTMPSKKAPQNKSISIENIQSQSSILATDNKWSMAIDHNPSATDASKLADAKPSSAQSIKQNVDVPATVSRSDRVPIAELAQSPNKDEKSFSLPVYVSATSFPTSHDQSLQNSQLTLPAAHIGTTISPGLMMEQKPLNAAPSVAVQTSPLYRSDDRRERSQTSSPRTEQVSHRLSFSCDHMMKETAFNCSHRQWREIEDWSSARDRRNRSPRGSNGLEQWQITGDRINKSAEDEKCSHRQHRQRESPPKSLKDTRSAYSLSTQELLQQLLARNDFVTDKDCSTAFERDVQQSELPSKCNYKRLSFYSPCLGQCSLKKSKYPDKMENSRHSDLSKLYLGLPSQQSVGKDNSMRYSQDWTQNLNFDHKEVDKVYPISGSNGNQYEESAPGSPSQTQRSPTRERFYGICQQLRDTPFYPRPDPCAAGHYEGFEKLTNTRPDALSYIQHVCNSDRPRVQNRDTCQAKSPTRLVQPTRIPDRMEVDNRLLDPSRYLHDPNLLSQPYRLNTEPQNVERLIFQPPQSVERLNFNPEVREPYQFCTRHSGINMNHIPPRNTSFINRPPRDTTFVNPSTGDASVSNPPLQRHTAPARKPRMYTKGLQVDLLGKSCSDQPHIDYTRLCRDQSTPSTNAFAQTCACISKRNGKCSCGCIDFDVRGNTKDSSMSTSQFTTIYTTRGKKCANACAQTSTTERAVSAYVPLQKFQAQCEPVDCQSKVSCKSAQTSFERTQSKAEYHNKKCQVGTFLSWKKTWPGSWSSQSGSICDTMGTSDRRIDKISNFSNTIPVAEKKDLNLSGELCNQTSAYMSNGRFDGGIKCVSSGPCVVTCRKNFVSTGIQDTCGKTAACSKIGKWVGHYTSTILPSQNDVANEVTPYSCPQSQTRQESRIRQMPNICTGNTKKTRFSREVCEKETQHDEDRRPILHIRYSSKQVGGTRQRQQAAPKEDRMCLSDNLKLQIADIVQKSKVLQQQAIELRRQYNNRELQPSAGIQCSSLTPGKFVVCELSDLDLDSQGESLNCTQGADTNVNANPNNQLSGEDAAANRNEAKNYSMPLSIEYSCPLSPPGRKAGKTWLNRELGSKTQRPNGVESCNSLASIKHSRQQLLDNWPIIKEAAVSSPSFKSPTRGNDPLLWATGIDRSWNAIPPGPCQCWIEESRNCKGLNNPPRHRCWVNDPSEEAFQYINANFPHISRSCLYSGQKIHSPNAATSLESQNIEGAADFELSLTDCQSSFVYVQDLTWEDENTAPLQREPCSTGKEELNRNIEPCKPLSIRVGGTNHNERVIGPNKEVFTNECSEERPEEVHSYSATTYHRGMTTYGRHNPLTLGRSTSLDLLSLKLKPGGPSKDYWSLGFTIGSLAPSRRSPFSHMGENTQHRKNQVLKASFPGKPQDVLGKTTIIEDFSDLHSEKDIQKCQRSVGTYVSSISEFERNVNIVEDQSNLESSSTDSLVSAKMNVNFPMPRSERDTRTYLKKSSVSKPDASDPTRLYSTAVDQEDLNYGQQSLVQITPCITEKFDLTDKEAARDVKVFPVDGENTTTTATNKSLPNAKYQPTSVSEEISEAQVPLKQRLYSVCPNKILSVSSEASSHGIEELPLDSNSLDDHSADVKMLDENEVHLPKVNQGIHKSLKEDTVVSQGWTLSGKSKSKSSVSSHDHILYGRPLPQQAISTLRTLETAKEKDDSKLTRAAEIPITAGRRLIQNDYPTEDKLRSKTFRRTQVTRMKPINSRQSHPVLNIRPLKEGGEQDETADHVTSSPERQIHQELIQQWNTRISRTHTKTETDKPTMISFLRPGKRSLPSGSFRNIAWRLCRLLHSQPGQTSCRDHDGGPIHSPVRPTTSAVYRVEEGRHFKKIQDNVAVLPRIPKGQYDLEDKALPLASTSVISSSFQAKKPRRAKKSPKAKLSLRKSGENLKAKVQGNMSPPSKSAVSYPWHTRLLACAEITEASADRIVIEGAYLQKSQSSECSRFSKKSSEILVSQLTQEKRDFPDSNDIMPFRLELQKAIVKQNTNLCTGTYSRRLLTSDIAYTWTVGDEYAHGV